MTDTPIFFGWRDRIEGDGFVAGVSVHGRAVIHAEDDGYVWVEGVNPGGFAGTGLNQAEALEDFRRSYLGVLYDLATEAAQFDAFRSGVEAFFANCGPELAAAWDTAVEGVRRGAVDESEWLRRKPADETPCTVVVEPIEGRPRATNNRLDEGPALAA